jgi:hypothetical protein
MAERNEPMKQFQELLQDDGLRQRIQGARDEQELAKVINSAGDRHGFKFEDRWVTDLLDDVKLTRWPPTFTEQELMLLASTYMNADTAPKLCHSDSCGGGHAGCC